MNTDTYKCARCKEVKLKTEFHRCSASKQGVVSRCKACVHEKTIQDRPRRQEYDRDYRQKNRLRLNEQQRLKNRRIREKRNQLSRNWKAKHPMDSKRTILTSNAAKYGVPERIRLAELEALWAAQGGICPFTLLPLEPRKATAHHIVHLAKGGSNTLSNLIFTTRQVHHYKRQLSLEEFCRLAALDNQAIIERIQETHQRLNQQRLTS